MSVNANHNDYPSEQRWLVYAILSSHDPVQVGNLCTPTYGKVEQCTASGLNYAASRMGKLHKLEISPDRLADYSSVVNALHAMEDILPFRFGTILPEPQIASIFSDRHGDYRNCMESLKGCAEVNAHWAFTSERNECKESKPNSGANYLRAKQRKASYGRSVEASIDSVVLSIRSILSDECIATKTSTRYLPSSGGNLNNNGQVVASLNLLVRRQATDQVLQVLRKQRLKTANPVVVSGPWAPYSFIDAMAHGESPATQLQSCKGVQLASE